ncbi:MAG TPA: LysR family transcriptional regulator, partial [Terriglobales bacterium]|nr:LysR family transcriptional regulator [Terriglobales bacterium]
MDFDQLHVFLEVARLKSFSRAAMSCFRTQPAISAQIRLLEEEVGERLFDRSGGKVALTEAGRCWQDYAQRLLALRDEGRRALADLDHSPRGELRIAANEGSCLHVLPEVFAAFKRLHPAVQVHIRRGEHNDILEEVLENRADFGVVSLPVRDPRLKVV